MIKTVYKAGELEIFKADGGDLPAVSAFLNEGRNALRRIEFFYPYTEEELKSVLENGCFLCAADGDMIAGTFALDTDEKYGAQLAERIAECTKGRIAPRFAFETSGLMVAEKYRRRGIAGALADAVIAEAQKRVRGHYLCGVVQAENTASISVFFSRGFVLAGVYSMGGEYDFVYLTRPASAGFDLRAQVKARVPFRDVKGHHARLADGLVGSGIREGEIEYSDFEEIYSNYSSCNLS